MLTIKHAVSFQPQVAELQNNCSLIQSNSMLLILIQGKYLWRNLS